MRDKVRRLGSDSIVPSRAVIGFGGTRKAGYALAHPMTARAPKP